MRRIELTKPGGPGWLVAGMFLGWPFMEMVVNRGLGQHLGWSLASTVVVATAAYGLLLRPVQSLAAEAGGDYFSEIFGSRGLATTARMTLILLLCFLIAGTAWLITWESLRLGEVWARARGWNGASLYGWQPGVAVAWWAVVWTACLSSRDVFNRSIRFWSLAALSVAVGAMLKHHRGLAYLWGSSQSFDWASLQSLALIWPYAAAVAMTAPLLDPAPGPGGPVVRRQVIPVIAALACLSLFTQAGNPWSIHFHQYPTYLSRSLYGLEAHPEWIGQGLLIMGSGLVPARLACFLLVRLIPAEDRSKKVWAGLAALGACLFSTQPRYGEAVEWAWLLSVTSLLSLAGVAAGAAALRASGMEWRRMPRIKWSAFLLGSTATWASVLGNHVVWDWAWTVTVPYAAAAVMTFSFGLGAAGRKN